MTAGSRMLADLLQGLAPVPDEANREITGISLDSRDVQPGFLFIARHGISTHGLKFATQAVDRGAAAILWEPSEQVQVPQLPDGLFAAPLEPFAESAGQIVSRFFDNPSGSLKVIGVTGTNGKTTVSQLVAQALDNAGFACGIIGTLGWGRCGALSETMLTTPDLVPLQKQLADFAVQDCTHVAMEVSSHALDQGRVCGLNFHTAVFTNISRDHLDYHQDEKAYAAAKSKLFLGRKLEGAVINAEDPFGIELIEMCADVRTIIAYRIGPAAGELPGNARTLVAENIVYTDQGAELTVMLEKDEISISVPFIGRFNVYNVLAVIGVLLAQGLDLAAVPPALQDLQQVKGRMQRFGGGQLPVVIVDYAHTPDALMQALTAARSHAKGNLLCVFGCGGDRDSGKRPEMGRLAERLADQVILTDDNPRTEDAATIIQDILNGMQQPERVRKEHDRAAAIHAAIAGANPGDVVLIAGKGHEDYQISGDDRVYFSDRDEVLKSLGVRAA